jgi:hypothetical protein
MKKILLFLVIALSSTVIVAQQVNDPNAEKREVGSFHGISLSSAFDVYLSQGTTDAVAVSASEKKYRDRITVEVKNGILHIGYKSEGIWGKGNHKLKAYISFKQIDNLTVSGACDVYTAGTIKAPELNINLSGASDLKTVLGVGKLKVDMSGASDLTVSGKATDLDIDVSGASGFKGFDLVSETCNAKASGASDIKITVNKELSAHASGASDINYRGTGVIKELKSSGSSGVNKS